MTNGSENKISTSKDLPKTLSYTKRIYSLLPVFISIAILVFILRNFHGIDLFLRIDLSLFVVASVCSIFFNVILSAYKWQQVLDLSNVDIGYTESLKMWSGLNLLSAVTPFQSGGIVNALALKKRKNLGYLQAFESVLYDRYLFVAGSIALIAIGQLVLAENHNLSQAWILLLSLLLLVCYFFDHWIFGLIGTVEAIGKRTRLLNRKIKFGRKVYLLILSTVCQSSDVISMYFAVRCLGIDIDFSQILGVYSIIMLASMIPVTFNGLGLREGLVVLWMGSWLGYDPAVASSIIVYALEFIIPAIAGIYGIGYYVRTFFAAKRL